MNLIDVQISPFTHKHTDIIFIIFNVTVHAGLVVIVTRRSWYQVGQDLLADGAILAEVGTNCCNRY